MGHGVGRTKETLMFCSVGFPILFFPLLPNHADVHGKNNNNDQGHI